MKKGFLKGLAALLALSTVLSVTSCGKKDVADDGVVEITMWSETNEDSEPVAKELEALQDQALAEKFPNIKINKVIKTMGTDYRQEYDKALMAGNAPDFFAGFSYTDIPTRIENGTIADITYILNFVRCYNSSVIRMGDSNSGDVVRVGNINIRGVNQPDVSILNAREDWAAELGGSENRGLKTPQAKTFVVFERDSKAKGEYKLMYENYAYYSYHENEFDFFKSLPTRGNLAVSKLNERGAE